MPTGTLYLIPSPLAENSERKGLPPELLSIADRITHFVVEDEKTVRRYLKALGVTRPIASLSFSVLSEHTKRAECEALIAPLREGHDMALISEAGCPCVADPGEMLVELAQKEQIPVVPLVGPSSIILALMASGLNGQNFVFHGYVPVDVFELQKFLKEIEQDSKQKKRTQIFMDTPYRTQRLFDSVLKACQPNTRFCMALNLTAPDEKIITMSIARWRTQKVETGKTPAMCLLQA